MTDSDPLDQNEMDFRVSEETDTEISLKEKDEQEAKLRAVKASILQRKKRAARIRKALCKKSKILKIKLWQNVSRQRPVSPKSPTPSPPRVRSPSPSSSPTPSPPPLSHRFSPDITCYRRKPLLLSPMKPRPESSSSRSTSSSSEAEEDDQDKQEENDEASNSSASVGSSDEAEHKCPNTPLILSNKGEPVVQLDASIVEDFIRSGKPIRAAALAALEAVHGKKFTEVEALQRLRKAYIVKPSLPKGRGRRSIFKKNHKPTRAPKLGNWCSVVNSVTYKKSYFQVGDIVYVTSEDRHVYFLQIQSLLMDWRDGETYASMLWLTPKPGFKGPRFPFHPQNYDLRRDIGSLECSLESVIHVLHCPLDYFDGHPSFWQPVPGTVYQRLGEPLVKWVRIEENKPESQHVPTEINNKEPENTCEENNDLENVDSAGSISDDTMEPDPTSEIESDRVVEHLVNGVES